MEHRVQFSDLSSFKQGFTGSEIPSVSVNQDSPTSLYQVIGRRWTEELVLHAMEELEAARKEHGSFKLELIC